MMAYVSRLTLFRKALKEDYDVIITERCLNTDCNVFAKMLYDSGNIEEMKYILDTKTDIYDYGRDDWENFTWLTTDDCTGINIDFKINSKLYDKTNKVNIL